MKLYTKFHSSRKFVPLDSISKLPDYKKAIILHPNKATEVPDATAKILLEQDEHLISRVPYDSLSSTDRWGRTPPGVAEDFNPKKELKFPALSPDDATDGSLLKPKKATPEQLPSVMTDELIPDDVALEPEQGPTDEQLILQKIEELGGTEVLTGGQLIFYGKQLGLKIPRNLKVEAKRKLLDDKCIEIFTNTR